MNNGSHKPSQSEGRRDRPAPDAPTAWVAVAAEHEADVLALIEGGWDSVRDDRREALRGLLATDPRLSLLVAGARADRAALVGLGTADAVAAPSGLADEAAAEIDAQELAALARDERRAAVAGLPVSALQPRGAGVLRTIARSPWTRRFAAAACLGGAGWLGWTTVSGWMNRPVFTPPPTGADSGLLLADAGNPRAGGPGSSGIGNGPAVSAPGTAGRGVPLATPGRTVVESPGGTATDGRRTVAAGTGAGVPGAGEGQGGALASPVDAASVKPTIEAALAAAREGRLVAVVLSPDGAATAQRLAALAESRAGSPWRLSQQEPAEAGAVMAAIDRTHAAAVAEATRRREALTSGDRPVAGAALPELPPPQPPRLEPAVFVARVDASDQALAALARTLSAPVGTSVQWMIVDSAPTGGATGAGSAQDGAGLLWWTKPPSAWPGAGLSVPVVVRSSR